MIVFDRLWETMRQKGVTQYKLINVYGISPAQITRLKRNANINTHTLNMLCEILDCNLEDISEYKKEPKDQF
ncbi:MAG: helix-turn-helix transcriptional regulator [Lachnospiraceae bacterium]|nr:helix-turn-helix transcriptional regulator [Lachnospiraceae bacterium]